MIQLIFCITFSIDSIEIILTTLISLLCSLSTKAKIPNPKRKSKEKSGLVPRAALNVPKKAPALQGLIFPRGFLAGHGAA